MWLISKGVKRIYRLRMTWRAIDICNKHGYKYKSFVIGKDGVIKESGMGDIDDRLVRWFVKGET